MESTFHQTNGDRGRKDLAGVTPEYPHMKRAIAALFAASLASTLLAAPAAAAPTTILESLHWRSVGPYIGGRVVAVAGVPSDPKLFYMGGVEGGIWKSVNYGNRNQHRCACGSAVEPACHLCRDGRIGSARRFRYRRGNLSVVRRG